MNGNYCHLKILKKIMENIKITYERDILFSSNRISSMYILPHFIALQRMQYKLNLHNGKKKR